MTTPLAEDRRYVPVDATAVAVRQCMVDSAASQPSGDTARVSRAPAGLATLKHSGEGSCVGASLSSEMELSLANWLSRIPGKSPTRRSYVIGGVILLVALNIQVVFWLLLFLFSGIVLSYIYWGSDGFWHRVILSFRWVKRRYPRTARQLKVRSFLLAKQWDRAVQGLPAAFPDHMKSPNLRDMAAADAQHDAALTERLRRLG